MFYGGRINATKLLVKTESSPTTTKIKYVDFTSLFPEINKNGVYPMGHPIISTENIHPDVSHYFGLIQCHVLAPRGLYHPVLPFKCHNKLMFTMLTLIDPVLQRSFLSMTFLETIIVNDKNEFPLSFSRWVIVPL